MPASATRPPFPSGLKLLNWFLRGWTALVFVFLYVPIVVLVVFSFNSSRLNIVWESFTLGWYEKLFANAPLIRAAKNSLIVASASTILSVIIGTVGAWLVVRRLMGLDWTFLPLVAVAVALGAMALTLAFGLAGTLAALRQRPLALLRNE